jgi:Domain of unknown function (DUF397)
MEDQDLATQWRKSSFSNGGGNACVETASGSGVVLVRDTTNRNGGTLTFSAAAWERFTASLG